MRRYFYLLTILAMISTLFLAACGGDDEEAAVTAAPTTEATPIATTFPTFPPAEMSTPEVTVEPTATPIVGDFTMLLEALEITGLADLLSQNQPYTLFAPPDPVFTAFLQAQGVTKDEFFADAEALTNFLRYHLVFDAVHADTLARMNGATLTTLADDAVITVTTNEDGDIILNDTVKVIVPDVAAWNGLIQVIDGVLTIPAEAPAEATAPVAETTIEATVEVMAEATAAVEVTVPATEEATPAVETTPSVTEETTPEVQPTATPRS